VRNKQVGTRVDDEMFARLKARADSEDSSPSNVVYAAIEEFLNGTGEALSSSSSPDGDIAQTLLQRLEAVEKSISAIQTASAATGQLVKRTDLEMARVLSSETLVIGCLAEIVGYEKFNEIAAKAKEVEDGDVDDDRQVLRAPQRAVLEEEHSR